MTCRSAEGPVRTLSVLIATLLLVVVALVPAQAAGAVAGVEDPPHIDARAAVLIDAESGRVLYAQNAGTPMPMASTTKIMTGWLLAEMVAPETTLWVPFEARGIIGSKLYLEPGERYSARDMLLGLMIASANDAAVAIAVNLAGSVEDFADLMNQRAAELGLKNTRFANPHGLDQEGHYASALDLALLARAAMTNPAFREAVSLTQATIAHPIAGSTRDLHSHNRFLVNYRGATGIKTGFTNGAGFSLVGGAERNGVALIGTILGGDSDVRVAQQMGQLMDWGFSAFAPQELVAEGERIVVPAADGAEAGTQTWIAAEPLVTLLPAGEPVVEDHLTWRVEGDRLHAFYQGEAVGSIALVPEPAGDQVLAESDEGRSVGSLGLAGTADLTVFGVAGVAALGVTLWVKRRRTRRRQYSWQGRRDGWGPKL